MSGKRIIALRRRAKYILIELDSGHTLLAHLGMTGRFTVWPPDGAARNLGEFYYQEQAGHAGDGPHDHLVIDLDDGARVVYTDPRRFGFVDLIEPGDMDNNRFLAGLGVEPLGNELHADFLAAALAGRKSPLKAALLDQRIIAGLGNIYVCEALYRARLSPKRLSGSIVRKRGPRLSSNRWCTPFAPSSCKPLRPAVQHCATMLILTAVQANFSNASTSMTAKASHAGHKAAPRRSGALSNPAAPVSIAPLASDERFAVYCR